MYFADSHMHSIVSRDSESPRADMARGAVAHGVSEICFTDHVEPIVWGTGTPRTGEYDWAALRAQYDEAVRLYGDRITLRLGMELGEAYLDFPIADHLADTAPGLDFVIGSVHMFRDEDGCTDLFYVDSDRDDAYYHHVIDAYLTEMLSLAKWGRFSVLGHLTLPVRCINEIRGKDIPFRPHMAQVEEILRILIEKGVGIECNTNRGHTPLPDAEILTLYRRLGGEILTLGSDAHTADYLGCAIAERQELLLSCGFRYFTTFQKGKPDFRPL